MCVPQIRFIYYITLVFAALYVNFAELIRAVVYTLLTRACTVYLLCYRSQRIDRQVHKTPNRQNKDAETSQFTHSSVGAPQAARDPGQTQSGECVIYG